MKTYSIVYQNAGEDFPRTVALLRSSPGEAADQVHRAKAERVIVAVYTESRLGGRIVYDLAPQWKRPSEGPDYRRREEEEEAPQDLPFTESLNSKPRRQI